MLSTSIFAAAALLVAQSFAQTSTSCNPLKKSCPPDPALGTTYNETFDANHDELDDKIWKFEAGSRLVEMTDAGASMKLKSKGDSITAYTSFYIFWGEVEVTFQAAKGQGIISTLNLLSDDLDEIDIEIQGANKSVSTNWYGQGDRNQMNGEWHPLDDPADKMHTYKISWTEKETDWYIDGTKVRTVPSAGPKQYPQTPSFIKMGVWPAGDADEKGVVEWAGGPTDWSQGPFEMIVQSIRITDGTKNQTSYEYEPKSDGSFKSIKLNAGKSDAAKEVEKPPSKSLRERWQGLSTGAKIGIAAGVIAVAVLGILGFVMFFLHQRKQGRKQRAAEDLQWDRENSGLMSYQMDMKNGGFASSAPRS